GERASAGDGVPPDGSNEPTRFGETGPGLTPLGCGKSIAPEKSLVHEASRCGASAGGLKPPPRETPSTGFQPHRAGGGRPAVNGGPARRRQRPVNGPAEARWWCDRREKTLEIEAAGNGATLRTERHERRPTGD